jgi:uncharacterized membrane protein
MSKLIEVSKTINATNARLFKGLNSEEIIYKLINKKHGIKAYDLIKELNWSSGKVHSALNRLKKKELIKEELIVEKSRTQKLIFPVNYKKLLV